MNNPQLSSFDTNMLNAYRQELAYIASLIKEDNSQTSSHPIVLEYLKKRILEIEIHGIRRIRGD